MYNTKFILKDGKEIYPGYLDKEKRAQLREENKDVKELMKCGCKPEANLYYNISKDLKIYPLHNNYEHAINCCRHIGETKRKTAYVITDDGEIIAYTKFNPKIFEQSVAEEKDQDNDLDEIDEPKDEEEAVVKKDTSQSQHKAKEPELTLEGLIRSINVDTYTERVLNNREILSRNVFSKCVFHRMKKIRLSRAKRTIGELSLEKDGVRFFYLPYHGYIQNIKNGVIKTHVQTINEDGEIFNNFIFPDILTKELISFERKYGRPGNGTMIAGFQYIKKGKTNFKYKVLGRIHIFNTTTKGLYCRNEIEEDVFRALESIASENKKIRFYIPPEDQMISGIVEIEGIKKKILMLLRGKKDERITYDPNQYVPLVIEKGLEINERFLYKLLEEGKLNE